MVSDAPTRFDPEPAESASGVRRRSSVFKTSRSYGVPCSWAFAPVHLCSPCVAPHLAPPKGVALLTSPRGRGRTGTRERTGGRSRRSYGGRFR